MREQILKLLALESLSLELGAGKGIINYHMAGLLQQIGFSI